MRFWTVDQVVANAMTIIKEADDMDRGIMKQWVYSALREIGPSNLNEKVVRMYPNEEGFLRKPDDLIWANDIALFNSSDTELHYKYRGANKRIHTAAESVASYRPIDLGEDADFFILGSNRENVAYADLRYYSTPTDHEGKIQVPEHTVEPIKMYINYQWQMREARAQSAIESARFAWEDHRRRARGRNKMPSMLQGAAIADAWMSMINKNETKTY